MITKIEKSYTRTVNLGNYENVRVSITLTKNLEGEVTAKEIQKISNKLLALEKAIVENEASTLLKEREE